MHQSKDKLPTNQDACASSRRATFRCAPDEGHAVAVPSNTATDKCNLPHEYSLKVLRFGVDSLYLSYQGDLYPDIHQQLQKLKQLAQSPNINDQSKAQLTLGDHLFEVKDKGSSMFSYVIEDNAFRIQLSQPNKMVPMAYIKVSSEYLTYQTAKETELHLFKLMSELGLVVSAANVSRIDLYVDFVSDVDMESWTRDAWVTHAASINAYSSDQRFTGWTVGAGSAMSARLYDKLTEIARSHKGYLIPLWKQAGWLEGEKIWRLEFQFKRDVLVQKGIPSIHDVLAHLNGLWSYATTEWLRLTLPNADDQTRSRWPIHPMWASLASIDWESNGGPLKTRFSYTREPNQSATLKRAYSALTTWMASNELRDYDSAIHKFFIAFDAFLNNLAMDQGLSLEQMIEEKVSAKARLFNTMANAPAETINNDLANRAEAYRKASDGQ